MRALSDIELPTLPQVAVRLIELCNQRDTDLADLVEAISLDAALSARLLKLANSSYYGQQHRVDTLRRAACVIGLDYVKHVALGFTLAEVSSQWRGCPINLGILWQGNLLRACLARQIAVRSEILVDDCREQAMLIGLLQDLAVPVIAMEFGRDYERLIPEGGLYTSEGLAALERERLKLDHSELAGQLCEKWQLPREICEAVRKHHERPKFFRLPEVDNALWQIAFWVGAVPFNPDASTARIAGELRYRAISAFGMDTGKLARTFTTAIEEFDRLRPMFNRSLPEGLNGADLMRQAQALISGLEPGTGNPLNLAAEL
jgi:HD-like signal output (HDOD) protein